MTTTIKALRDSLFEMIAQVELHAPQSLQRVGQSDVWVRNDYSQKAIDSAKAALTADASEDAPTGENILARTAKLEDFHQSDPHDYAQFLAYVLWRDHYKEISPDFTIQAHKWGVMSQIDNMLTGLTRKVAAARPAPVGAVQAVESIEHDFEFNRLLEAAYSAEVEQRALDGEFGSAALADKADAALIAYIDNKLKACHE